MAKHRKDLTQGNINKHIINLTLPMIFGILSIVAFNLADTYFIGKLGTLEMAAITFTTPVVLILNSLNLGLGLGAGAVISRAVGENNWTKVKRLTTDSLSLGLVFALGASVLGLLTIRPLFTALGASHEALKIIQSYMSIWYIGVPFIVIPMVGNNGIRALGDTKTPSIVMAVSSGINILLDPLFIFGWGPIPAMGVQGAAIATVFARSITFCVSLYVLGHREKVISFTRVSLRTILSSWGHILYIGLPTAIARMIIPFGIAFITNLIASYGDSVVAGFGIATKIEYFSLTFVMAVSSIMPAFIGQNFGAGRMDRIHKGILSTCKFSLVSGFLIYGLLFMTSPWIGAQFSKDPQVIENVVLYLRIMPLAYPFQGVTMIITSSLNAIHQPIRSALINLGQMMVIYVPLAFILSGLFQVKGIFMAFVVSHLLASLTAYHIMRKREIQAMQKDRE